MNVLTKDTVAHVTVIFNKVSDIHECKSNWILFSQRKSFGLASPLNFFLMEFEFLNISQIL